MEEQQKTELIPPPSVVFDADDHTYREKVGGRVYDSSTQILANAGVVDYSFVEQWILERKSKIGLLVHEATKILDLENITFDQLIDDYEVPQIAQPYTFGYYDWKVKTGFVPRIIEQPMITELDGMKYGMTLDREGEIPGFGPTVVELKTTASIERAWGLQLASYDMGLPRPATKQLRRARVAVQLKPDGKFIPTLYDKPIDYDVFRACLVTMWWKRNEL